MSLLKHTARVLMVSVVANGLAGCGAANDRSTPTYTAARHLNTGSHVPQASDANSGNSVYAPTTGQETIGGTAVLPRDSSH